MSLATDKLDVLTDYVNFPVNVEGVEAIIADDETACMFSCRTVTTVPQTLWAKENTLQEIKYLNAKKERGAIPAPVVEDTGELDSIECVSSSPQMYTIDVRNTRIIQSVPQRGLQCLKASLGSLKSRPGFYVVL